MAFCNVTQNPALLGFQDDQDWRGVSFLVDHIVEKASKILFDNLFFKFVKCAAIDPPSMEPK